MGALLTLTAASLGLRAWTLVMLFAHHAIVPVWDTSARLVLPSAAYLEPLLRWDSLYFLKIAQRGYAIEQEYAFGPGLPAVMRLLARSDDPERLVWAGVLATTMASLGAVLCFYKLTARLFPAQPSFAMLSALLLLLGPSPPTFHAVPYTEPFAAFFTYSGMLAFESGWNLPAAGLWAAGSAFRAQGIVLGLGFFGWRFGLGPLRSRSSIGRVAFSCVAFALLAAISVAPFVGWQYHAYATFCTGAREGRPWCSGTGMSYGWIQSHYWEVGFLRYWTLLQLPNFLLAAPVLALSAFAAHAYYRSNLGLVLVDTLPFLPLPRRATKSKSQPSFLSNRRLTPYVHLSAALTCLLLFASHTQIILRVCVTNPVPWWFAAHLLQQPKGTEPHKWGRRWALYCVVWGQAAIVLWAGFYPPA